VSKNDEINANMIVLSVESVGATVNNQMTSQLV